MKYYPLIYDAHDFQLCWRMNGLRLTCCKSAKDRTSMSVTLEMVKTLEREHDMNENVFNKVLNSVRR